jgi:hypothetical protein
LVFYDIVVHSNFFNSLRQGINYGRKKASINITLDRSSYAELKLLEGGAYLEEGNHPDIWPNDSGKQKFRHNKSNASLNDL